MSEMMFSGDDLGAVLPESLRGLVVIDSLPLPAPIFHTVARALQTAAEAVTLVAWVRRRVLVVFATAPFRLNLPNGELRYTPNPEVIHCHVEDIIFIDVNKLLPMQFQHQVATILEELVHVLLSIADEELVSVVVAHLYDGVQWVDGKYVVAGEKAQS